MNAQRVMGTSLVIGFLGLLVFPFQNCAPSMKSQASMASTGELRRADDWYKGKALSFVEPHLNTKSTEDEVNFDGICPQLSSGTALQWRIEGPGSEVIDSSISSCEAGGFRIRALHLLDMECGVSYRLNVVSAKGEEAGVGVTRRCSPLGESLVEEVQTAFSRRECYLESLEGGRCSHVCYSNGKQTFEESLAEEACMGLSQ